MCVTGWLRRVKKAPVEFKRSQRDREVDAKEIDRDARIFEGI